MMKKTEPIRVAISQGSPAYLNAEACVDSICSEVARASGEGARLVLFGETFVPGYPLWCDEATFGTWEDEAAKETHARYIDASIEVPSKHTDRIAQAAADLNCLVGVGISERVGRSLFNSLLLIDETSKIVMHRRKLIPTHGERMVWKQGDAHGLAPVETSIGRIGGLICWEHWMPAPRQLLHDGGEEIHLALWPGVREMHLNASRHHAFEGRCFVLAAGITARKSDFPADFPLQSDFKTREDPLIAGGSAIIGPDGSLITEPILGDAELIIADLDMDACKRESLALDTAGHYARPDLFQMKVDERRIPARSTSIE